MFTNIIEQLKSFKLRTYLIAGAAAIVAFAASLGFVDLSAWLSALTALFQSAPVN